MGTSQSKTVTPEFAEKYDKVSAGLKYGSTGANLLSTGVKTLGGIAAVAAAVNPVVLPAEAGAALAVAIILSTKAGHRNLLKFLSTKSSQFTNMLDFINLAELIIAKMKEKNPAVAKYNFHSDAALAAAEDLKTTLLAISPPSVLQDFMRQTGTKPPPDARTRFAKFKNTSGKLYGMFRRVFLYSAVEDSVRAKFEEVLTACEIMETRFFLFLITYENDYAAISEEIQRDPQYQKTFGIAQVAAEASKDVAENAKILDSVEKKAEEIAAAGAGDEPSGEPSAEAPIADDENPQGPPQMAGRRRRTRRAGLAGRRRRGSRLSYRVKK